jgi:hypothetical protein
LIERHITIKKNGRWVMRNCEAVLYVTSLDAAQASPADLLAYVRGHWKVEHLHWLRSPGVPRMSHDVASERSAESFCNTSRGCGARCCRCSEAWPAWTCHMHHNLARRRRLITPLLPARSVHTPDLCRSLPPEKIRDVIWAEDKSTIRTGSAPQVLSALTNLVITLFRLQGVTKIKAETRRNAQNPRRPLQLLTLRPG